MKLDKKKHWRKLEFGSAQRQMILGNWRHHNSFQSLTNQLATQNKGEAEIQNNRPKNHTYISSLKLFLDRAKNHSNDGARKTRQRHGCKRTGCMWQRRPQSQTIRVCPAKIQVGLSPYTEYQPSISNITTAYFEKWKLSKLWTISSKFW